MSTIAHTAHVTHVAGAPRSWVRRHHLEVVVPAAFLLASTVMAGRLVGAVMAEPAAPAPMAPVSISTSGTLAVDGLAAGGTTVSTMKVTNEGAQPIRWAAYPRTTGTAGVADRLAMSVYAPTGAGCSALGSAVSLSTPSAAPLAPGQTATVCVVLTMPADAAAQAGTVTPGISFTGTPA